MLCVDHASQWIKINWGSIGAVYLDNPIQDSSLIALYNVHAILK